MSTFKFKHRPISSKRNGLVGLKWMKWCTRAHFQIPVFRGCDSPLLTSVSGNSRHVHGGDGLGDCPELTPKQPPSIDALKEEHAASAICRLAREHKGNLIRCAYFSLSNLFLKNEIRFNEMFLNWILNKVTEMLLF